MAGRKVIEALQLHKKGFNCAQSVGIPFAEEFGISKKTVMCCMEGFGAGMGGYEHTCGALSAAIFVAGLKYSDGDLACPKSKANTYAVCKKLCEDFQKECGSVNCADIRGIHTKKPLKSCDECIMIAARLVEKAVESK